MEALKLQVKMLNVYFKQLKKESKNENLDLIDLQEKYNKCIAEIYNILMCLPEGDKIIKAIRNKSKKIKNLIEPSEN